MRFDKVSYSESREALYYDFSADITEATRRISQTIIDAQDEHIKKLFEECWDAGAENNDRGGPPYSTDFEQWWAAFLNRLREEQRET